MPNQTDRKPTVLFLASFMWTGGERVGMPSAYHCMHGFVQNGYRAVVILPTNSPELSGRMDYHGMELWHVRIAWPRFERRYGYETCGGKVLAPFSDRPLKAHWIISLLMLVYHLQFWTASVWCGMRVFGSSGPDIVYGLPSSAAPPAWLLSVLWRVPFIYRQFGSNLAPHLGSIPALVARWSEVLPLLLPFAHLVMTNDGTQGDRVARRMGVPDRKTSFWLNGVDRLPRPSDETLDDLRSSLGMDKQSFMILSSTRLAGWKRVDRSVAALAKVVGEVPDAHLVLLGWGDQTSLRAFARDLGVEGHVHFMGGVDRNECARFFWACDVLISTQDLTNVSNAVLEAMAIGKPVVVVDTGDTVDLVQDGVTGYVLGPDDIGGVAAALVRLARDAKLRADMGASAQRYADEHFDTWERRIRRETDLAGAILQSWWPRAGTAQE